MENEDRFELLICDTEKKYKYIFNRFAKYIYQEDREKVLDLVIRAILSHKNIENFRFCRLDNRQLKREYDHSKGIKNSMKFDTSIYGNTKTVYFFGFDF